MSERSNKVIIAGSVAAVACAVYFIVPAMLNWGAAELIRKDDLKPSDVIIALGGDARCLREKLAAELFLRNFGKRLIVSGVPYAWGLHTGEAARKYVITLGVPEDKITVLHHSWNTRQEALSVRELMQRNSWQSAIIVTSPFHSRRALYTFERYAPGFTFFSAPLPAAPPEWQPDRWWSRRGDMGFTLRELLSWGNTLAGGLR